MSADSQDIMINHGMGKKTLSSYIVGLVLSLTFTFAAFAIVSKHAFADVKYIFISLAVLAVAQLVAQTTCFLRMNTGEEGKQNSMPFLFVILIIAVVVGGTLWIMYNLNYNMVH